MEDEAQGGDLERSLHREDAQEVGLGLLLRERNATNLVMVFPSTSAAFPFSPHSKQLPYLLSSLFSALSLFLHRFPSLTSTNSTRRVSPPPPDLPHSPSPFFFGLLPEQNFKRTLFPLCVTTPFSSTPPKKTEEGEESQPCLFLGKGGKGELAK